ncbi:putative mannosyltransferase KTR3 [Diplonema papillatum]|nr:putative mannosyltransferase KTR3 [Diplonema papillatum]
MSEIVVPVFPGPRRARGRLRGDDQSYPDRSGSGPYIGACRLGLRGAMMAACCVTLTLLGSLGTSIFATTPADASLGTAPSCIGWEQTQFCSYLAPVQPQASMSDCNAEIQADTSGRCLCTHGIVVAHNCEKDSRRPFTCASLCDRVLQAPRTAFGRGFVVLVDNVLINASKRAAPIVRTYSTERVRQLQPGEKYAAIEEGVLSDPKTYPTMRDHLQYAWPSQGGWYSGPKPKAVYLVLTTDQRGPGLVETLQLFEKQVNQFLQYPYAVFNDRNFSAKFVSSVSSVVSTDITFNRIPSDSWNVPTWIDRGRMQRGLKKHRIVPYMDSVSYRKMCRWNSGFFYREAVLQKYDWFWRVDDDVFYFCSLRFDPFVMMTEKKKRYGFTIAMDEHMLTIRTLGKTVKQWAEDAGIEPKWSYEQFTKMGKKESDYNGCHFWTNFEIGKFDFFRSAEYNAYFQSLDKAGGFFYERWGDAPVHFLAIMYLLNPSEVTYLEGIGYAHSTSYHHPEDPECMLLFSCFQP